MTETLDRDTIVRALDRLSHVLGDRGITGEVCLLGGTVMVLAFKTRARTKDVDAIFHPPHEIRDAARLVQAEMDLLIRHLGLGDADQALSIVARYYPEERIPVRARYLIEDLFTRMAEGAADAETEEPLRRGRRVVARSPRFLESPR